MCTRRIWGCMAMSTYPVRRKHWGISLELPAKGISLELSSWQSIPILLLYLYFCRESAGSTKLIPLRTHLMVGDAVSNEPLWPCPHAAPSCHVAPYAGICHSERRMAEICPSMLGTLSFFTLIYVPGAHALWGGLGVVTFIDFLVDTPWNAAWRPGRGGRRGR